jgi:hypothetical protein
MNNFERHALTEFRAAGWVDEHGKFNDEMQEMICKHVMKMIEVFAEEGHSGSTAPYAISLFKKIASFEPITPLTGEDWEWRDTGHNYQNMRASHVFKDYGSDRAYDINGKVFWEWSGTKEDPYKSHYTCRESRVYVDFPYTPKTEYVYRYSDATPSAPPQTEEGLL